MSNEAKVLTPEQVYFIEQLEAKAKEFEEVNWANTKRELDGLDARRQELMAQLNQIQGAVISAHMMIQQELAKAGVTVEAYQSFKYAKNVTPQNNVVEFPNKGNEDETVSRPDDDSEHADAE
jgi:hypothetical protein